VSLFPILTFREQVVLWQGPAVTQQLPDTLRSLLMVPITHRRTGAGRIGLLERARRSICSPDMKLARAIAEHAGAQIENGLLQQERLTQVRLETEMSLARRVQMSLLPKSAPRLPGAEFFAHTRPASQVGGTSTTLSAGLVAARRSSLAMCLAKAWRPHWLWQ